MLSGDNSILQKATDAKEITDKNQIVEQARLDILGELADKKGEDPTETKIKEILGTYFKEDTIPEDLSDLNQVMKTKSGGYTVKLSEVLNGVTIKQEVKETTIAKSTKITDSYVGYYADIDNDGDVDGIIYADMIVGNTKSGRWNNDTAHIFAKHVIDTSHNQYYLLLNNVMYQIFGINLKEYLNKTHIYYNGINYGDYINSNNKYKSEDLSFISINRSSLTDRVHIIRIDDIDIYELPNNSIYCAAKLNIMYYILDGNIHIYISLNK